jgi:hypothetical protein
MAAQFQSARIAQEVLIEVTTQQNYDKYPYYTGEYHKLWEVVTKHGAIRAADLPADFAARYGKSRRFVIRNTKVRRAKSGKVYPIAQYLEFGGANPPAFIPRHILTKAVNKVLAKFKYGIEFSEMSGVKYRK